MILVYHLELKSCQFFAEGLDVLVENLKVLVVLQISQEVFEHELDEQLFIGKSFILAGKRIVVKLIECVLFEMVVELNAKFILVFLYLLCVNPEHVNFFFITLSSKS